MHKVQTHCLPRWQASLHAFTTGTETDHPSTLRTYEESTLPEAKRVEQYATKGQQPSPQRIHNSFLPVPGVVSTELLNLLGGEAVEAKSIHPLLGPLRYNSNDQVTMVKIENFVVPIFYCITQDVSCVLA